MSWQKSGFSCALHAYLMAQWLEKLRILFWSAAGGCFEDRAVGRTCGTSPKDLTRLSLRFKLRKPAAELLILHLLSHFHRLKGVKESFQPKLGDARGAGWGLENPFSALKAISQHSNPQVSHQASAHALMCGKRLWRLTHHLARLTFGLTSAASTLLEELLESPQSVAHRSGSRPERSDCSWRGSDLQVTS